MTEFDYCMNIHPDINYQPFFNWLDSMQLDSWSSLLPAQIEAGLNARRFGDLPQWLHQLEAIPPVVVDTLELRDSICLQNPAVTQIQKMQLMSCLRGLMPWRKGPFSIFGIHIDSEWRSDWKWQRLQPHIEPITGCKLLDVGAGNGYFMLRLLGAGASTLIGIDPSPLYIVQFYALKKLIELSPAYPQLPLHLLPLRSEQLPPKLHCFDKVFSMGVLYHHRSPIEHLQQLRGCLRPGGQLILETLIIDEDKNPNQPWKQSLLVPENSYAKMPNVWFIPSLTLVNLWLHRCKFERIKVCDINATTTDEQRSTDWMRSQSLQHFIDSNNPEITVEGYPAPKRAIITAVAASR